LLMIFLLIRHQQDLRLKLFTTLRWCAAYSIQFYLQRKCIYINNLKNPLDWLFLNQNKRFRLNYSQYYQVIHHINTPSK
ncbi:hypothetical protein N5B96_07190, partial [Acinetobacter johnsonii]|uniref:hypothetical protein n=1 Tax=Acinetobacter johnsonii TaxID=40214 RepID=UPI00244AF8EA